MSAYQEIEIKLGVDDLAAVAKRLEQLGATLHKPRLYERNVRYENADKTLTQQEIVVRLRQDDRIRLTYKEPSQPVDDSGTQTRFEAEVEVSDFNAMETILGKLGYQPYLVYEKYRTTYRLDETEIVLDELPYGNFVEIEGSIQAIQAMIERLELKAARRYDTNYIGLFERVKQALKLNIHDLTFANFENVPVPQEAFNERD